MAALVREDLQTEIFGAKIHTKLVGDKSLPPLFLIHSFYLSGEMFDALLEPLAEKYYLVLPDLPGSGRSERLRSLNNNRNFARVLESLRNYLGSKKIDLFGFSAGGVVALEYALTFPERVDKVSVQGAPYYYRDYDIIWRDKIILALSTTFPKFPSLLKSLARYQLIWRLVRFFYRSLDKTMRAVGEEKFKQAIAEISPQAAYEWGQDILKVDLRDELGRITAPVQLIVGKKDPYLSLQSVYRMASLIGDARVDVVRGGDHEVTIHQPLVVGRLLLEFLALAR